MAMVLGKVPRGPTEVMKSPLPMTPRAVALEFIDLNSEEKQLRAERVYELAGLSRADRHGSGLRRLRQRILGGDFLTLPEEVHGRVDE